MTWSGAGSRRAGEIVLFNAPFLSYSDTVVYRTNGARVAAEHGAVAALVRSVGPTGLRTPHTGSMQYAAGQPRIPAAAIAAEDANRIARLTARGRRSGCVSAWRRTADLTWSRRTSSPRSVDVSGRRRSCSSAVTSTRGTSAPARPTMACGCVVTWEALRLMKQLGLRPRRTVRLVLWTNEENGFAGANAYAATACRPGRPARLCARGRLGGVCSRGARLFRQPGGAGHDQADRVAAEQPGARRCGSDRWWRRHRPHC